MFYIRADGNEYIGMGHIMRCLSIAEAANAEYKPIFITADEGCTEMIRDRGFDVIVLGTDYKDMHAELPLLKKILVKHRSVLLVDSYQADIAYFTALSGLARIACLEDMGKPYPVDLLINYNIYAPKLADCYFVGEKPLNVLLGAEYVPLRQAFQTDVKFAVKDKVTDVMITTGGSDPHFAADAFADVFIKTGYKITVHIVSGPFNKFADRLKEKYSQNSNVVIHEGLKDLKSLMQCCDVVLTAAGSTVYETCAVGVPMIVFYFAENQRQGACELASLTDVVNTGCFCTEREKTLENAVKALEKCILDKEYRMLLNIQEKRLIDAKGAERIARALLRNGD